MAEKISFYLISSREHKVDGLRAGLAPAGIDVGWIRTPPHTPEPDHEKNLSLAAQQKLSMFVEALGNESIRRVVGNVLVRLLIMDVSAYIITKGKLEQVTTPRGEMPVGEKINGTAKKILGSDIMANGMKGIFWANSTAVAEYQDGDFIGDPYSVVVSGWMYLNEQLTLAMESGDWPRRMKQDEKYLHDGAVVVVNSQSNGGVGWTDLPMLLRPGEEMIWRSGGESLSAKGLMHGKPQIDEGMICRLNNHLRGFPGETIARLRNLT